MNFAPSPTVVKFYFGRLDPSLNGSNNVLARPVAQVVMPMPGFLQMAAWFEINVKKLIQEGRLTEEQVAEAAKSIEKSLATNG